MFSGRNFVFERCSGGEPMLEASIVVDCCWMTSLFAEGLLS